MNISQKEYDRVSWHLYFLGHYCLLSVFKTSSSLNGKYGLSRRLLVSFFLTYIYIKIPYPSSETLCTPVSRGVTSILSFFRIMNAVSNGEYRNSEQMYYTSLLLLLALFTKHKFKDKVIKNFKKKIAEH